jgi:hypothetical protein
VHKHLTTFCEAVKVCCNGKIHPGIYPFLLTLIIMHRWGFHMFENKRIAKEVLDLVLEYSAKLEKSAQLVRENCASLDIYLTYKKEVDHLVGRMLTGIITPIYERHRDLKPPDSKEPIKKR